jgi:hypothetical protein
VPAFEGGQRRQDAVTLDNAEGPPPFIDHDDRAAVGTEKGLDDIRDARVRRDQQRIARHVPADLLLR